MLWRCLKRAEEVRLFILDICIRWGWAVSIMPWMHFNPRKRTPSTHWTGSWVRRRACLNAEGEIKALCLCWGLNPSHPIDSQSLYWLSYPTQLWLILVVQEYWQTDRGPEFSDLNLMHSICVTTKSTQFQLLIQPCEVFMVFMVL
jgi:hypothetical protein